MQAWVVARKDATELWRDGRMRALAGLIIVLLLGSAASGWAGASRLAAEHADAKRAERDRWLSQGDVNPHAAAHYGTIVFRPVEPLSSVDPGLVPFVGAAVFLEAHQQQLARHRPIEDAAPMQRFGTLSAALCLQVLVPLFIVLLTFGSVAAERERGTWRLLIAAGANPRALALGKALGVALPLAVVLGPAVLAGVAVLAWSDGVDRQLAVRAMLMAATYIVYLAFWIAAGLAVSARVRSSRAALIALLALWFVQCVVAPPLAMTVAKLRDQAPSAVAFAAAIDDERAARPSWDDRVAAATDRFLQGGELPIASNPEVVALVETEQDDTETYERHFDRLSTTFVRQADTYQWIGIVAPMLAVQSVSMSLAATDYAHTTHFSDATRRYRTALLTVLNAELARFDSWRTFNAEGSRDLWARVPEFEYDTPDAQWALRSQTRSIGALVLWLLGSAIVAARWLGVVHLA